MNRPRYRHRRELEQFERLNTPLWVFDVDRHRMWWGNASAFAFWRVDSLEGLLARDYSTDSETVRTRLRQMVERPAGGGRIQETWTLYPGEIPTTVIADIQPVLIEDGRHAVMIEASRALDFEKDPEALRILEAARSSALMVSSFTMSGQSLSQNPAAHACYGQAGGTLAGRFADPEVGASLFDAVRRTGQFEEELAVRTARGERVHRVLARRGRDPITGEFVIVLNEEDVTAEATLRRDLQRINAELETRVAERTKTLEALNEDLRREIADREVAEEKLRRAQRMEAVGQLTGGVAHDFNNLLAVIMGNAELLELRDGGRSLEVAEILKAAARGSELTQRLLAFSRRQSLRPEPVDLGGLVAGMADLLRRTLGETVELVLRAGSEPCVALADPGQVENALLNLALNARDALQGGGRLIVEYGMRSLGAPDVAGIEDMKPGEYAVLAVSDTGTGMSPEVQARAFEPFYTTKEVGQGSGLGLSMVYGFAKQSGGHAAIRSGEGCGTTVTLYLPGAGTAARDGLAHREADIPRGRGESVLVIEDNPQVLILAVHMLEDLGYRVMAAPDAARAEEILADGTRIDLLLSDVVLPGGVSGPEFAEKLHVRRPDTRIVFMAGYPAEPAGGNPALRTDRVLLGKPFRRRQLALAIRQALD